ncbi:MAG: histidine kinase [Pseudomonadota bacterium]
MSASLPTRLDPSSASNASGERLPDDAKGELFLPDFCAIASVFWVVLVGELLAFVLVLTPTSGSILSWGNLALTSVFIQWVGLSSAATLCVIRPWLAACSSLKTGAVTYFVVVGITGIWTTTLVVLATVDAIDPRLLGAPATGESFWFTQLPQAADPAGAAMHWTLELYVRNLGIAMIVAAVALRYLYIQFQWKRQMRAETQARLQALQARIRPHFLFNSMNTIASFTRSDPALAEEVVEDLADLFRASLADADAVSSLGQELDLCRQYARIEGLRLGSRLSVTWDVDPLDAMGSIPVPGLILQPLIENAIYHGVEPSPDGGWLRVEGRKIRGSRIRVEIVNSFANFVPNREGHKMGQANVRERIAAFFGGGARFEVHPELDQYRVVVEFPPGIDIV